MKRFKKNRHIIYLLLIVASPVIFFFLIFVANMTYKYTGKYPDCYTISVYSIPNASGSSPSEWIPAEPVIKKLEEDEFGRKMFLYSESSGFKSNGNIYIVISQFTNDKEVFYYPDYNYLCAGDFKYNQYFDGAKIFTDEEMEHFKQINDWNQEINIEKCIKRKIIRKKASLKVDNNKKKAFEKIFQKFINDNSQYPFQYEEYLISDAYGRSLYFAYGSYKSKQKYEYQPIELMIIFNPDGTYNFDSCIMDCAGKYNFQEELKQFKEKNGWDNPYLEE